MDVGLWVERPTFIIYGIMLGTAIGVCRIVPGLWFRKHLLSQFVEMPSAAVSQEVMRNRASEQSKCGAASAGPCTA